MNELEPQKNWWNRNWKWFVPVSGCFLLFVFVAILAGSLFFGITSVMNDSVAYKEGMKRILEDEYVVSKLGEPIEKDGVTKGAINYNNGIKSANLTVPIKGSNGTGTLTVVGQAVDDVWHYSQIEVFIKAEDTIVNLQQRDVDTGF